MDVFTAPVRKLGKHKQQNSALQENLRRFVTKPSAAPPVVWAFVCTSPNLVLRSELRRTHVAHASSGTGQPSWRWRRIFKRPRVQPQQTFTCPHLLTHMLVPEATICNKDVFSRFSQRYNAVGCSIHTPCCKDIYACIFAHVCIQQAGTWATRCDVLCEVQ
jgi:hypothetical protein